MTTALGGLERPPKESGSHKIVPQWFPAVFLRRFDLLYCLFNLPSKSPASKRSDSGGWDMLVSVRVQALTEMAAKLPGGYE